MLYVKISVFSLLWFRLKCPAALAGSGSSEVVKDSTEDVNVGKALAIGAR